MVTPIKVYGIKRGDVSSNWNVSFLSATKYRIFCPEIFFTLTNSVNTDEMPHDGISPVYKVKNMYRKIHFTIEMHNTDERNQKTPVLTKASMRHGIGLSTKL